jgi:hypothetical protein
MRIKQGGMPTRRGAASPKSGRSYEESCALLDRIVGRCVREPRFAGRVLADPEEALKGYGLTKDELDDFRILKAHHLAEAKDVWTAIRTRMDKLRGDRPAE